ncbi:hypothetical protein [Syntrophorhabdus aromaticivorans]|uniref:hypothetical protein n=1 Tax=Syntrophorhabdus aromaticivorans TaxID=328301 RepID=UPI0012EC919E|nr:hypothetical protein [Syntrophorhabdus aromaticivorans]
MSPGMKCSMGMCSPFSGERGRPGTRLRVGLCWSGTHESGCGDVSPGMKCSMGMCSPFSGERGRLRQLCWWRGRREPR